MAKERDIREVQRDLALIKSPAAGMKRVSTLRFRGIEVEEEEAELDMEDTSLMLEAEKTTDKEVVKIGEVHEADEEMEAL